MFRSLWYGLLTILLLIGVGTLVYSAVPSGSPVLYTSPDTVTMPAGTAFNSQIFNAIGPASTLSSFTASQTVAWSGDITPTALAAATHNYSPTGLSTATVLRLSATTPQDLTGIAGGSDGRWLVLHNIGTQNIVLKAENALSTAANRFDIPADVQLATKSVALLQYDSTASPSPPGLRWRVVSSGGGGAGGTASGVTFTPVGGIVGTNVQTAIAEVDAEAEKIAQKTTSATSVPNGYMGADPNGRVPYNRVGSSAVHTSLAAANAINPTTTLSLEIGIQGTSAGVTDLSPSLQIVAGIDGQLLILYGTSATNTVQIDDVTVQAAGGVRLCGGKGSVIVGLNNDDLILRYSTTLSAWVQLGCQSLQSAYNTGRDIFGATTTGTAVRLGGNPNEHVRIYTPPGGLTRIEGITGGSPNASHEVNLGVGGNHSIKNSVGATIFNVAENGTITGTTSTTGGVCQTIDSVTFADDNRPLDSSNRARTITGIWCNYAGSAPTVVATFTLSDGSGNAMTITGTSPTCVGPGTIPAIATVTANNTLTPREMLRWSTSNTPNPASDIYEICVGWVLTD